MELGYARRLLLDFGKGCPYHGTQATGNKKIKQKQQQPPHTRDFCVLNNELT